LIGSTASASGDYTPTAEPGDDASMRVGGYASIVCPAGDQDAGAGAGAKRRAAKRSSSVQQRASSGW
jgi:hypothetical protein